MFKISIRRPLTMHSWLLAKGLQPLTGRQLPMVSAPEQAFTLRVLAVGILNDEHLDDTENGG